MALSQDSTHLSSELFELLWTQRQFDLHVLCGLNLQNDFGSENFLEVVGAEDYVHFPLAAGVVQGFGSEALTVTLSPLNRHNLVRIFKFSNT